MSGSLERGNVRISLVEGARLIALGVIHWLAEKRSREVGSEAETLPTSGHGTGV